MVPLVTVAPFLLFTGLKETNSIEVPTLQGQLSTLWALVQKPSVFRPCAFIFLYSTILVLNLPRAHIYLLKFWAYRYYVFGESCVDVFPDSKFEFYKPGPGFLSSERGILFLCCAPAV